MRVLFISWWWPYPANNGSKIRVYNLLRHLGQEFEVTLLSFAEQDEATAEQITHMQALCKRVEVVPKPTYQSGSLKALLGYLSRWPRSLVDVYSEQMAERVKQACVNDNIEVIVASEFQTMRYLDLMPQLPGILEEVEITQFHNQVEEATEQTRRLRAQMTLKKFENSLRQLLERGVHFTVVSEAEKQKVSRFAPSGADIRVVPNGVDTEINQPDSSVQVEPYRIIYTGAVTYHPNFEAVQFFIHEVLPLIRTKTPQVQFVVTGDIGDVDVGELAAEPGVTFTGYLPSVADAVRSSSMMVVPLQSGGGTRLKIFESMALGVPIISTSKGAEGIEVHDGEDILIADNPQQMADAVLQLFSDVNLRTRLAQAGRKLVEQTYDWGIIVNQLNALIQDISQSNILVKEKQSI